MSYVFMRVCIVFVSSERESVYTEVNASVSMYMSSKATTTAAPACVCFTCQPIKIQLLNNHCNKKNDPAQIKKKVARKKSKSAFFSLLHQCIFKETSTINIFDVSN